MCLTQGLSPLGAVLLPDSLGLSDRDIVIKMIKQRRRFGDKAEPTDRQGDRGRRRGLGTGRGRHKATTLER